MPSMEPFYQQVCPFLIRVFIRKNEVFRYFLLSVLVHRNRESEFTSRGDVPRNCEINIHTWYNSLFHRNEIGKMLR